MKRFKRFLRPPTALAEQQALGWMSKITGGELDQKQKAEFAVWLSLHPRHRELFDGLTDVWEFTADLSAEAQDRITQAPVGADQPSQFQQTVGPATESVSNRQAASQPAPREWLTNLHQRWNLGSFGIGAAASICAAVALVLLWASLTGGSIGELHETGTGGYAKIALDDGSILHLNTNTRARVLYTSSTRQVQLLGGELFIEVATDTQRPLTVQSETLSATAIGTAFGVAATPLQQWVEVSEGEVLVSNRSRAEYRARGDGNLSKQQALLAGDKLTLDEDSSSFDSVELSTDEVASWRSGQLIYRDIALRDLVLDLNRYHRQQLVVHDDKLGNIRLSAVLNSNDHPGSVAALSSSLGLESHELSETVILLAQRN